MAQDIKDMITRAAQARGVDPAVAIAIARAESSLRPDAKNPDSSAKGLYQVTDETWSDYGGAKGKALDPNENIRVGMDILVKNGAMLAKTLGRDPRAEELYAAHFFGPTGSRRVLSADPLASISSVVSKRVMQSNPNLKGQTVNEVLTGFAKKLGTGGQRYPTSDVTRTVVPDAYSREADVEIATGTKAPTARDRISIYGPNYQAAVAAMMLGEATDDEQEDAASPTTAVEAQSARNSLRAMDLGPSVNPFDAMQPPLSERPGLSMPKLLAEGGEVQDDTPRIQDVSKYATRRSEEMFPGMAGQDDPRDAARHLLAAGTVARKYGPTAANLLGKTHEYTSNLQTAASLFGIGEPRDDFAYDTHNNRLGIELGQRATSQAQLEQLVKEMAMQSSFEQKEGRPWIMSQEAMDARADRARQLMERPPDAYAKGGEAVADDPEAALMAGAGDSPPPRVTDAQAALAMLRGAGICPMFWRVPLLILLRWLCARLVMAQSAPRWGLTGSRSRQRAWVFDPRMKPIPRWLVCV